MKKQNHHHSNAAPNGTHADGTILRWLIVLCGACILASGCASAAIQPPPPTDAAAAAPYAGPTLPKLLGIQDCAKAAGKCAQTVCTCLKRQFPAAAAGAPNLGPVGPGSAPAVKCAAEMIAEEAKAPQKIDAIRYLGTVGCTKCYPCAEEGLLAALDDCTESVRFEAAKALRQVACDPCKCCQCTNCCSQRIYEKLYKIGYGTNDDGCPAECSPRVRRMARQALQACGGPIDSEASEPTPTEGPSGAAAAPAAAPPAAAPPAKDDAGKEGAKTAAPADAKPAPTAASTPKELNLEFLGSTETDRSIAVAAAERTSDSTVVRDATQSTGGKPTPAASAEHANSNPFRSGRQSVLEDPFGPPQNSAPATSTGHHASAVQTASATK